MKTPEPLLHLLDELKANRLESSVETNRQSKAVIFLEPEAVEEENGISLSKEDCILLFSSVATVRQLWEALDEPAEASLVLHDLIIDSDVLDLLEQKFVTVDEE